MPLPWWRCHSPARSLGVEAVISNYPDRLLEVVAEY